VAWENDEGLGPMNAGGRDSLHACMSLPAERTYREGRLVAGMTVELCDEGGADQCNWSRRLLRAGAISRGIGQQCFQCRLVFFGLNRDYRRRNRIAHIGDPRLRRDRILEMLFR
jgi:hypothetical protein